MTSLLIELIKQDFGISGRDRWWRSDIHSSLVVDAEKDVFHFNSRDLHGNAVDYLVNIRGLKREDAENFVRGLKSVANLPKESGIQTRYDKLVDLFHNSGKRDRDYWYRKGLSDKTIDFYRLGFHEGWYLLPIFNGGLFYNFQCRRDIPEKRIKFWYKDVDISGVVLNSDILKFVKKAYMTEGTVDCLLLNQLGFPTVSGPNGTLACNPSWSKYFTNIEEIMYIADNDATGIKAAEKVADILGSTRVKVFRFKDKREKYGSVDFFKDGGTLDDFKELLATKSVYGFEKGNI